VGSAVGRLVVEVRADRLCRFAAVRAVTRASREATCLTAYLLSWERPSFRRIWRL